MKLKSLALFLFGIILIFSCKNSNKVTAVNETWQVEFEKGGCLDVCKAYTIAIEANGKFKYKGNFNVKHLGLKIGSLKPVELSEINSLLNTIKWDNEELSFGSNSNGAQLKSIEYTTEKIKKKITYYSSEPQSIKELEHYIDSIINKDEL